MNIVSVVVEPIAQYQLKLFYENYLESATISVTSEDSSYPKYRLYDRAQGLLFKGTSHPNPFEIKADLGVSGPYPGIDTVILGANHNLAGLTLTLKYSDNDAAYTVVKSWIVTAGINRQSFTGANHRYWILSIANPPANPEMGELFLTKQLLFDRNPNWGYGYGDDKNFNRLLSRSGMAQKTKWGERKKGRSYELMNIGAEQRADLEAFDEETEAIKNFYIEDLEGNLFFAELPAGLPRFRSERGERWSVNFEVVEVLD